MQAINKPSLFKVLRHTAVSLCMVGMVALGFASSGGGDKKTLGAFRNTFTPLRSAAPFSLKTTPVYSGSSYTVQGETNNKVSIHTLITYQRGNTTFILPFHYKVNVAELNNANSRTNLQFLGVKIKMPK